jgi:hypothetical protein
MLAIWACQKRWKKETEPLLNGLKSHADKQNPQDFEDTLEDLRNRVEQLLGKLLDP